MPKRSTLLMGLFLGGTLLMSIMCKDYENYSQKPEMYFLHTVSAGETIWGIAEEYNPGIDTRLAVDWVIEANDIPKDCSIYPGQVLNIPTMERERVSRGVTRSREPRASKELIMEATAYTQSVEEGTADGITATGTKVRPGVVAVDPQVIPLGSRLWVEGYGYALAEDKGDAIKGNRIDVFMVDKQSAMEWGRRTVKVRVLE